MLVPAPASREWISFDFNSCGMGHLNDQAGIVGLSDHDINLAFTQPHLQLGKKAHFFVEQLIAVLGVWAYEQINVPALFIVIRAGTKQEHASVLTKGFGGCGPNGLNLLLGQSHFITR
jgi:hypothetical protein